MSRVVNCAAYSEGRRAADLELSAISEVLHDTDQFVWIGLHEPDGPLLAQVQRAFGLHELAVEDALLAHQRPKIERYEDSLFVVLRTAQRSPASNTIEYGETHLFVGPKYVVSVRHGASVPYTEVRARCEASPLLLGKGPGFVLYALMDFIVDQYFPIVDAFEDKLEQLEQTIFGGDASLGRAGTAQIYDLKRDLLDVKRAVMPLIDVCNRLVRFDLELIHEDTRPYFRDIYDHVIRINEMLDTIRELLTTALEANLALMSIAQNEAMKRLAGWASIIAVPTMIAGIYGMNFSNMPELQWRYGYPFAMAVMVAGCGALFAMLRRSGWL